MPGGLIISLILIYIIIGVVLVENFIAQNPEWVYLLRKDVGLYIQTVLTWPVNLI